MIITKKTKSEEMVKKTQDMMTLNHIPNMLLTNAGKPNGFQSSTDGYEYWLNLVCNRHNA